MEALDAVGRQHDVVGGGELPGEAGGEEAPAGEEGREMHREAAGGKIRKGGEEDERWSKVEWRRGDGRP